MSEDPVAPIEQRIIRHMRSEHLGDLLHICQAFGGVPDATSADMVGVDVDGVDAVVQTPDGEQKIRLPFPERVTEGGQVRQILTDMTHRARAELGIVVDDEH